MSIEKNIQTLADNSERIAAALEGILAAISNGVSVNNASAPASAGAEPSGVTTTKVVESTSDAEAEAAAKAEKAKKAAATKAAKEEAAAKAAAAELAAKDKAPQGVSYDSIKAVVTELAGKGPDGITAIKGVLNVYGAAKASDVPEEKWAELLAGFEKAKAELEGNGDFA